MDTSTGHAFLFGMLSFETLSFNERLHFDPVLGGLLLQ